MWSSGMSGVEFSVSVTVQIDLSEVEYYGKLR